MDMELLPSRIIGSGIRIKLGIWRDNLEDRHLASLLVAEDPGELGELTLSATLTLTHSTPRFVMFMFRRQIFPPDPIILALFAVAKTVCQRILLTTSIRPIGRRPCIMHHTIPCLHAYNLQLGTVNLYV